MAIDITLGRWHDHDAHIDNMRATFVEDVTKGPKASPEVFAHLMAVLADSVQMSALSGCYGSAILKLSALYMLVRKQHPGSDMLAAVVELSRAFDFVARFVVQNEGGRMMHDAERDLLTQAKVPTTLFNAVRAADRITHAQIDELHQALESIDFDINSRVAGGDDENYH